MFAICRTEKLKTYGNAGGLNKHLTRTMEVPNADKELQKYNRLLVGTEDLVSDIKSRITSAGIEPRKNAVLAVEHLLTASPEFFGANKVIKENAEVSLMAKVDKLNSFVSNSQEWLNERYGKENVVNVTLHLDEKTPHIHAVVVPIDTKGKLNARAFLGGREKMREMQNSFADKMKSIGLNRGVEGSKAKHTAIKEFYGMIGSDQPQIELVKTVLEIRQGTKVIELQNIQQQQNLEISQSNLKLKQAEHELNELKKKLEIKEIHISVLNNEMTKQQALAEFEKIEQKYNPKQDDGQIRGQSRSM